MYLSKVYVNINTTRKQMDYFGVGVDYLFYFHPFKIPLLGTENYTDKYLLSKHYF